MTNGTYIYGSVIGPRDRRKLQKQNPDYALLLSWLDEPSLPDLSGESPVVYVDLDDPRFADPEFLVSIATAGKRVKIVGKSDNPTQDESLRVARLGVSEVLSRVECAQRLTSEAEPIPEAAPDKNPVASKYSLEALIGNSPQMTEMKSTIRLLSDVDFPSALILGETGTGKSLVCKILHHQGIRSGHNLVEVNCSAIPDELFESELFGHIKGAFTGADTDKVGLFEYAQDGTLFLDEVGNLSAQAQAKLLKILEDKKLRKVGSVTEQDINVRVVAATNLELSRAVEEGSFRADLFYRLNLLSVDIPGLRKRPQDIPQLIGHYLGYYATMYAKPDLTITQPAINELLDYQWPGNVRELCNILERAVLLARGRKINPQDVRAAMKKGRLTCADRRQIVIEVPPQGVTLEEAEQLVVKHVLNMHNWNKSETARFLGISRPRLRRIIDSAGLEKNRRRT
ncbi:MAG: sigma-54-dependent Fis family transcriptional regulator [bacterium]|nr:sigma-54-dependent Fis family transcriptional regulator [bacterium]